MLILDPKDERQRLARLYGAMSVEELQELARDFDDLTDVARKALTSEMSRRGIPRAVFVHDAAAYDAAGRVTALPNLSRAAEAQGFDREKLVMVRQFRDLPEALIARSILDSAEMECWFGDDNLIRMDWLISNAIGGVKLFVRPEDADAAAKLLEGDVREEQE
jgi:hypothetical protein